MRPIAVFIAILLVLSRGVLAQEALPPDTVRGVVWDSLAHAPLVGAFVTSDTDASTVTDSLGQFHLVSAARVSRLVVYHEVLDRLGLGALAAERGAGERGAAERSAERDGGVWQVRLATPSAELIWARLCGGRRPTDGRGGIVFGSTRAADNRTRFAGARVVVEWESVRALAAPGDTTPTYQSVIVRSDSTGDYVACGVQEFGPAGLVATAAEFRSANILLPADERPLRRADLMLGGADRAAVSGLVLDEAGQPVADATITVDGVDTPAVSDSDGRFSFAAVPSGTRMTQVRKVGFLPALQIVDVANDGVRALRIVIEHGITLEGVKVTARATVSRDRREFDERRLASVSQVMDSTRVQQYPLLQSALRMFPSLVVQTARTGAEFVLLGRLTKPGVRCRVHIWVDGTLENEDYLRLLPLENIAAVELFNSDAFAPARYRTLGDTCNTLLIWTKAYLNR